MRRLLSSGMNRDLVPEFELQTLRLSRGTTLAFRTAGDPQQTAIILMHGDVGSSWLFRKVMGPLLRSAEQGADTLVWLIADDAATTTSGDFWLDRRRRSIHKLPTTKKTDTTERRTQLWNHVERLAGT